MRVYSHESTALAYDGAPSEDNVLPADLAGHRVVINPGVNELSGKDMALLDHDQHFRRAAKAGFIVPVDDEPPADEAPAQAQPKPQGKGKGKPAELPAEVAKERDDFLALTPDEQAAMYPALSPEGKAAVDAAQAGK
jgi:hypothetical protein